MDERKAIMNEIYQLANDPSRSPMEAINLFMQHKAELTDYFFRSREHVVQTDANCSQCARHVADSTFKLMELDKIDLSDCSELSIAFSSQNYLLVGGVFSHMQAVLYDALAQTTSSNREAHDLYCELEHLWSDYRADQEFIRIYQESLLERIRALFQGEVIFIV